MMSGVYKPLVIGLGVAAAIVAVYTVRRMDKVDGHQLSLRINPLKFITYLGWLLVEIAKTNIAVTRLILARDISLRQNLFSVKNTQRLELSAVIFANSITLTPGTITVEIDRKRFWVHAVNFAESDHADLADMDARVTATELGRA